MTTTHAVSLPAPIVTVLDHWCLRLERDAFAWWLARTDTPERFGPFISALDAVECFRDALSARHGLRYEDQQVHRDPPGAAGLIPPERQL